MFLSSHILSEVEARLRPRRDPQGRAARRRGDARRAAPPQRADGRGHVRGPGAGARARCPACSVVSAGPNALRFEVTGSVGPLIAALAEHPVVDADEPRALARGDLPAPLRRLRRSWRRVARGRGRAGRARSRSRARAARRARRARSRSPTCSRCTPTSSRSAIATPIRRSPTGLAFAHSFAGNKAPAPVLRRALRPADASSGYTAWRVGGTLAIVAAVFGLLAAVRALRTEEDTGRMELVLAGVVGRRTSVSLGDGRDRGRASRCCGSPSSPASSSAASPAGGSAYLALATASVVPVYVGVGALASQLAPTRRIALELGRRRRRAVASLLRVIADTVERRRLAALGDAARLGRGAAPVHRRAPAGPAAPGRRERAARSPLAARIAARRDIGTGVLPARDTADAAPGAAVLADRAGAARRARQPDRVDEQRRRVRVHPRHGLARASRPPSISTSVQREIAKLGSGSIATPTRLPRLRVHLLRPRRQPVRVRADRRRAPRGGRRAARDAALAAGRPPPLARRAAPARGRRRRRDLRWSPACSPGRAPRSQGVEHLAADGCSRPARTACPSRSCLLGLAALAYALVPRASAGIAYGLVTVTFLWQLIGSRLGAPEWLVELTPFAHVGLVPAPAVPPGSRRGDAARDRSGSSAGPRHGRWPTATSRTMKAGTRRWRR